MSRIWFIFPRVDHHPPHEQGLILTYHLWGAKSTGFLLGAKSVVVSSVVDFLSESPTPTKSQLDHHQITIN